MAILSRYLEANLMVAAGYLLARVGSRWLGPTEGRRLTTVLLFLVLVFPLAAHWIPSTSFATPTAQVWSGVSIRTHKTAPAPALSLGAQTPKPTTLPFGTLGWLGVICLVGGALFSVGRYLRDLGQLKKILRDAFPYKSLGRVRVLLSENISVPFAYRTPRRAFAVLPMALVVSPAKLRLALRHELQHHRQGDTIFVYWLQLLKLLYFWNPFSRLWEIHLSGIQEFACDEVLIAKRNISPRAYGGCLLEVAETALGTHRLLAGTTGMAVNTSGAFLNRRVKAMFQYKQRRSNPPVLFLTLVVSTALMACTAFGARGLVKDRRVSLEDARIMAENVQEIPVNINEAVLEQLNRLLGTPDGRLWVKQTLTQMENHREVIETALKEYGLPWELLAVGFIESGFDNKKPNPKWPHAAGIWQFVPGTAINYQLEVGPQGIPDERLDIPKATDAAMRYLRALNDRFRDWRLAVLGYNAGENRIQKGINTTGSRDPWVLIDQGFTGDNGYLARFMAAILILRNPEKVE